MTDKAKTYQVRTMIFAGVQVGLLLFATSAKGQTRVIVDLLIIICAACASIFAFKWYKTMKAEQAKQLIPSTVESQHVEAGEAQHS